jgi:hypothetical protein
LSVVVLAGGVIVAGATVASADAGHGRGRGGGALFVSPSGSADNSGSSCRSANYSTIQSAVDAASPGATIVVCAGSYTEDVVVSNPVSLRGRSAVLNGADTTDQMCEQLGPDGPGDGAPCLAALTIKSSHVDVEGFTVQGAQGEGILATGSLESGSISDITIRHNQVVNNDRGGGPNASTTLYPQCQAVGEIPGDCGEAIHLMGVYNSQVRNNYISGNSGGVLLTDEFGPTHDNVIEANTVTANPFDCGITVPGHNPNALSDTGERQPDVAGVFRNQIRGNIITNNGLQGEGAGVLFANAGPGTGSYDNVVEGNYIAGNELSGVTMHAHTVPPGMFEDMSGNTVVGNVIGTNNLGSQAAGPGDALDGSVTDPETTGVLVFSGSVPVQVSIHNNVIYDNHFGIWLGVGDNVQADVHDNIFPNTTVPVFTAPAPPASTTTGGTPASS